MADIPAMHAALQHLGFTAEAAVLIMDDQQINSIAELCLLTDEEVGNLCRVLHQPGGTIPNPDADNAGAPANIPNPGMQVS